MATFPRTSGGPQLPAFKLPRRLLLLAAIPLLAVAGLGYWWLVQRVEVGPNELCVLVRKVGGNLEQNAEGQVILYPALLKQLGATGNADFKGIIYEPLQPGRYFFDPFFWDRQIVPVTLVAQDEVGILIRKFGKPLAAGALDGGKTIADRDDERGPVRRILPPGRHAVNLLAYDVKKVKAVTIPPGCVGVQTLYAGRPPENPNVYVVKTGESGVQPNVLPPGLYQVNPYEKRVDVLDVRSDTLELRGSSVIEFPSNDSFPIQMEATVEYAIREDMAPYVLVAIGDHAQVVQRIILPYMNSLARIEGSKLNVRDFISGDTRVAFQNKVMEQLRRNCYEQGIEIRAVPIRRIVVPDAIAGPISQRQDAEQKLNTTLIEIKVAEAQAKLAEQEELKARNKSLGEASQEKVMLVTDAGTQKLVALTEAKKRLEVAKIDLKAAEETAAAKVSRGEAEAAVKRMEFEAKARPLAEAVAAFGDGDTYAQYFFYQKLAPALKNVLDSTDGPLAEIFRSLGPARTAVPIQPRALKGATGAGKPPATPDEASQLPADDKPAAANSGKGD